MEAVRSKLFSGNIGTPDVDGHSQNGHNVHDFVRQINEEYEKLNGDGTLHINQ